MKSLFATHNKPEIIQSDNEKEFTSKEFKQFLAKLNIQQIFRMLSYPNFHKAVESFNKTIQIFLESAKYHKKISLTL